MKTVFLTQRVDLSSTGEKRDCLDERWWGLLNRLNVIGVPVPNDLEQCNMFLDIFVPHAIILTGGNDPVEYGGSSFERDCIDEILIKYAIDNDVPLLGVCRGAQSIGIFFGGCLKHVDGHVKSKHFVNGNINRVVNSYHNWAIEGCSDLITVDGRSEDNSIEAISVKGKMIHGIMWHPERNDPFENSDLELLNNYLDLV